MAREKYEAMKRAAAKKAAGPVGRPPTDINSTDTTGEIPDVIVPVGGGAGSCTPPTPKKDRPPRSPFAADAEIYQKGRFPAGTKIEELNWDGTNWRGTLVVPPGDRGPFVSVLLDTALHRLLVRLYAEYRKWADQQPKEEPARG